MKKKDFKLMLIHEIEKRGGAVIDLAIDSALDKTVRHMRNTIGGTEWSEEQVGNAVCFYDEYGSVNPTFNERMYRSRDTGTSY